MAVVVSHRNNSHKHTGLWETVEGEFVEEQLPEDTAESIFIRSLSDSSEEHDKNQKSSTKANIWGKWNERVHYFSEVSEGSHGIHKDLFCVQNSICSGLVCQPNIRLMGTRTQLQDSRAYMKTTKYILPHTVSEARTPMFKSVLLSKPKLLVLFSTT